MTRTTAIATRDHAGSRRSQLLGLVILIVARAAQPRQTRVLALHRVDEYTSAELAEYDPDLGLMVFDRFLSASVVFPTDRWSAYPVRTRTGKAWRTLAISPSSSSRRSRTSSWPINGGRATR